MSTHIVTIADGKKGFSRLIDRAAKDKEDVIITKRGRPVAVIVPYEQYQHDRRTHGLSQIIEAREALSKSGLRADEIIREQRTELERRV